MPPTLPKSACESNTAGTGLGPRRAQSCVALAPAHPLISSLLHDPRSRPAWRTLLVVLLAVVCWLAFGPAPPTPDVQGWDKVNHLLAFLVLGTVATFAQAPGWRQAVVTTLALLLYGGFIEIVQAQLPHRHGDWGDWAADAVGLLCGLLLALAWRRATAASHSAASTNLDQD